MQRTVYSTKITYAKSKLDENNELVTDVDVIIIHETDEKKAIKIAAKQIGMFQPLKVEKISELYVLDDEIFFKYAKVVSPDTTPDTTSES